jgi:prophage regulatory protein
MSAEQIRILRLPEVLSLTGVSRSSIYKWVDEGQFPRPKQLGSRAIGWDSRELSNWMDNRPTQQEY